MIRSIPRVRAPWLAVLLSLFGLIALTAAAAGVADVAKHDRRMIGSGVAYDRHEDHFCAPVRRTTCYTHWNVHLAVNRAQQAVQVDSKDLYDLVGEGDRQVPVQLEEDTFSHHLSRAKAGDHWYVIDNPGKTALIVIIPVALVGLALIAISLPALAGETAGWLTANRRWLRWLLIAAGSLLLLLCVLLAVVGISDKGYDAGRGRIVDHYATFRGGGYHEGAHIQLAGETGTTETDSIRLYDLVSDQGSNLPVEVYEDSNDEVEAVTYDGDTYRVGASDLLALVVVIPLGLLGLAVAWLNARALLRDRRGREAPLAS